MSLRELLGIELPIIQAPMAGVQGSALALAVSNAGGLGSLPCALLDTAGMHREMEAIKAGTRRPFNVNFFCHAETTPSAGQLARWQSLLSPYYQELGIDQGSVGSGPGRAAFNSAAVELLEAFRPPVVSFHFGLPSKALLDRVKATGAKVISSATTIEEARWLEAHGADAVIAQGLEAGGHRAIFLTDDLTSQLGTFALLPQMVRAVKLPVIAAGGIADAKGVAAALSLGASGVQVGTAYLLCPEASTTPIHRTALQSSAAAHTALTNLFTGRPSRGIVNRFMRELGPLNPAVPAFPHATAAVMPLRAKAESQGSGEFSPLWSGQNAGGCKPVPAAELTLELTSLV